MEVVELRAPGQPERWVEWQGRGKRAGLGLGSETLAPASSKKASGLRGCSPAASVFPSVTCRSQGVKADPQGSWAQREGWNVPGTWRSAPSSLDRPLDCDVCSECCLLRLQGERVSRAGAAARGTGGLDSSLSSPHVLCDFEQIISPSTNHTPTLT